MRQTSLIVAIFLLYTLHASARQLDAGEKKIIMDAVTFDFKDGPAARFRWVPVTNLNESKLYCGMVNGKNSYGAFIGFVPFSAVFATKSDKVIAAALVGVGSLDSISGQAVLKTCLNEGIDPRKAE